jgi:hypothetical protein
MRAVLLRSLAVVAVGAAVLAGVLYVASTVDSRPPEVAGITLTQAIPEAPRRALITTSLEIAFTEPVDAASAAGAVSIDPRVAGSVSWSGSTMIFTPSDPLALAATYTVTIRPGVVDLAGNPMTVLPEPFSFETAGRPEVVETTPADDAVDVALDAPIRLTFSGLMDTASVEAALRLRPTFAYEVRWSGQLLEIVAAEPLIPDTEYRVGIGEDAFDVSGVALGAPVELDFRTIATGLEAALVMPADGADGIAPTSPIAVIFDRPVDPTSVSGDLFRITPDVAGSFELVDAFGEPPAEASDGRVLRFTPSGPLPANTTFDVELGAGVSGLDGGGLAEPINWTFTTGAPQSTLSNQITFLSDRAGVVNLWTMNPDGTAARQLSTELSPILDYAIAPDGSSFVVADGRRLVLAAADGSDRRVLTVEGIMEFDPTYSPDSQSIAFARVDADAGAGLGIWRRPIGGDATRVRLPDATPSSPAPAPSSGSLAEVPGWQRAPRYAPDGRALAYVDPTGWVGIVDLETGDGAAVRYDAQAPPIWLPDSSAILVAGTATVRALPEPMIGELVHPLESGASDGVGILEQTATSIVPSAFGEGTIAAAVAADGRIAYVDADGSLRIANGPDHVGVPPAGIRNERIADVAFAPGENAIVVVIRSADVPAVGLGRLERIELVDGDRNVLANDGRRPRWLP